MTDAFVTSRLDCRASKFFSEDSTTKSKPLREVRALFTRPRGIFSLQLD